MNSTELTNWPNLSIEGTPTMHGPRSTLPHSAKVRLTLSCIGTGASLQSAGLKYSIKQRCRSLRDSQPSPLARVGRKDAKPAIKGVCSYSACGIGNPHVAPIGRPPRARCARYAEPAHIRGDLRPAPTADCRGGGEQTGEQSRRHIDDRQCRRGLSVDVRVPPGSINVEKRPPDRRFQCPLPCVEPCCANSRKSGSEKTR